MFAEGVAFGSVAEGKAAAVKLKDYRVLSGGAAGVKEDLNLPRTAGDLHVLSGAVKAGIGI